MEANENLYKIKVNYIHGHEKEEKTSILLISFPNKKDFGGRSPAFSTFRRIQCDSCNWGRTRTRLNYDLQKLTDVNKQIGRAEETQCRASPLHEWMVPRG
jgi:hypothetical protein